MNKLLRTLVVDDSDVQRKLLVKMVNDNESLLLLDACKNALEARNTLKNNDIDIIFLDVEMPVINGFDFINSIEKCPQIVLTTVSPEYAMKAFDHDVTDYLLKPISTARFNIAVKKAYGNIYNKAVKEDEDYVFVNSNFKKNKIRVSDIKWVEGLGDYIKIVTVNKVTLVLSSMKAFHEKLPKDKFLRTHKSYIINLERVQKFSSSEVEIQGQKLPVSRNKKDALEEALIN